MGQESPDPGLDGELYNERVRQAFLLEVYMSPRPDVSEERRNQILEAAVTVSTQQGLHESRMDD